MKSLKFINIFCLTVLAISLKTLINSKGYGLPVHSNVNLI